MKRQDSRQSTAHVINSSSWADAQTNFVVPSYFVLSAVTHAPFHVSVLRPASQVGPMHEATGMGKLFNAALLSLINGLCANVCCATLLLSQLVSPACVQA